MTQGPEEVMSEKATFALIGLLPQALSLKAGQQSFSDLSRKVWGVYAKDQREFKEIGT